MTKYFKVVATTIIFISASLGSLSYASTQQETAPADLIIRGGTIYTGDNEPFRGDVAIRGDRIIYVGLSAPLSAPRIIDAKGLIVAPGFIDPHTHIDSALSSSNPVARLVLPFLTQGVTTAFIGVDGDGDPGIAQRFGREKATDGDDENAGSNTLDIGINFAAYVGLGAVRAKVIGPDNRAPTSAELATMVGLVDSAMCEGALGLSTGLFYAPQSFAKFDEVAALASAAAAKGGVYDSHIRDESSYTIGLKGAIEEALNIGRAANIPVHIAHIKALGVDVHGQAPAVIEMIENAQKSGQIVHADQYPWSASGTSLSAALLPRWAQDGDNAKMQERFDDEQAMVRMRAEIAENLRRRGGAASLLMIRGSSDILGKTLEQVAKDRGTDAIEAAVGILRKEEAGVASFNQTEQDIADYMKRPWVVTSSDANRGHPRYYASFARKYATYIKEKRVLDLKTFIDQSTITTARMFNLEGRGELKAGAYADVIAFDPNKFAPRADYSNATLLSTGMRLVVVNGAVAIENGEATGVANGRPLPHRVSGQSCN